MRDQDEIERIPAATQPLPVEPEAMALDVVPLTVQERVLSTRQLAYRRFKRHKLAIASLIVLLLIGLATLLVPLISQFNYAQLNLTHRLQGPNGGHWLGTDQLGRDEFTRVLYGGRISLLVGLSVAFSASVIGGVVGAIAGGLIITEAIFEYPGMGRYFVDALFRGDYQQILPWMMIAVFFVIIFNLVADILYAVLDPRIRYA